MTRKKHSWKKRLYLWEWLFQPRWGVICCAGILPFVWIRRLILFSDGWGILYPQNTTSGLPQIKTNIHINIYFELSLISSNKTNNFLALNFQSKCVKIFFILFHDDKSQRVSESVILLVQDKRRACFVVFAPCRHLERGNDRPNTGCNSWQQPRDKHRYKFHILISWTPPPTTSNRRPFSVVPSSGSRAAMLAC